MWCAQENGQVLVSLTNKISPGTKFLFAENVEAGEKDLLLYWGPPVFRQVQSCFSRGLLASVYLWQYLAVCMAVDTLSLCGRHFPFVFAFLWRVEMKGGPGTRLIAVACG